MPVTSQNAINFSRYYARQMAANRLQGYYTAKKFVAVWGTRNMTAEIGTPTAAPVNDGANTPSSMDPAITDNDLLNQFNRAQDVITDLENNSNAKLLQLLAVAPAGSGNSIF